MQLNHPAMAGTLESSDAQVTISPAKDGGVAFELSSTVLREFGRQIRETVLETLREMGVQNCRITVVDKGAIDCTLRARVECAVLRAADRSDRYPWR